MAVVVFGAQLIRQVGGSVDRVTVDATTIGAALEAAFTALPAVRGYVVNEHGAVRQHVALFLDGQQVRDKEDLNAPVGKDAELYVLQALSGG